MYHVFDHPASHLSLEWYYDINSDYWDGPPEVTVAYITRLFENPVPNLEGYTDAELNQGFWYLVSNGGSDHMFALMNDKVPVEARLRCIRSFYSVFEQLFATRCSPHLSHLDEPGINPLNSACYMWWDIMPLAVDPKDKAWKACGEAVLEVMERTLKLDSVPCRESALHGLGHWCAGYRAQVEQIIDRFIRDHPDIRAELLQYARQARTGCIL